MSLRILDRYIVTRFIGTFFGTLFMLVVVMLLSELTTRMNNIVSSHADPIYFYTYLLFRVPRFTSFAVPIAIMFSVTYTITQLSRTNELMAMMAAGWSYYRCARSIILASVAITISLFIFNETIVGSAEQKSYTAWRQVRGQPTLDAQSIINLNLRSGNTYYYFRSYKPKNQKIGDIYLLRVFPSGLPDVEIRARRAVWSKKDRQWIFFKGQYIKFDADLKPKVIKKFKQATFDIREKPELFDHEIRHDDAVDLEYLEKIIPARRSAGMKADHYEILWHERFSIPFTGVVVMLIGVLVGRNLRHATVATALGLTIMVVLVYFVIQSLGKSFAKDDAIPIWVGVWFGAMLYGFVAAAWYFKMEIWKRN